MNNIKEFLLDNYIWILVVILLLIITIIGFLADKNKDSKREKKQKGNIPTNQANAFNGNGSPITYQNNISGMNTMDYSNTVPNMVNNNQNIMPMFNNQMQVPSAEQAYDLNNNKLQNDFSNMNNQPINNNPTITSANMGNVSNPMPIDNINQSINPLPEPMYQPLSEQTPNFNSQVNLQQAQSSNNTINNVVPQFNNVNAINSETITPQPIISQPVINANPENFNMNQVSQFNNLNQVDSNSGFNQSPQQIPNNFDNTIPNTIPSPTTTTNPQPINFVYGANDNNQNIR